MIYVMVLVSFLIPALMLLFGPVLWKCPAREVDRWYGYRTKRALKSPEAYVFAQVKLGRIWTVAGAVLAGLTLAAVLVLGAAYFSEKVSLAALSIQLGVMLLCMVPVERALKKKFG